MKTLHLLRHGKAEWGNPLEGDFNRPLAERGVEGARLMGRHMASSGMRPDLVLCSAATRAQQTFAHFLEGFGGPLPSRTERSLYLAAPDTVIDHLRRLPEGVHSVLVVGHNPGLHALAVQLADETGAHWRPLIEGGFPTAALATLDHPVTGWASVQARTFTLREYVTPKILTRDAPTT